VVPAETLADAREFIDAELRLLDSRMPDQYLFDWLTERFGPPKEVAAAYAAGEPPVPKLPGYAPGWRVECVRCGRSTPASRIGFVRIGARSKGKYILGWCRRCRFFAILRVVRDLPGAS
jgi:hypothetical protein